MYNEELEKLIEMALIDGVLTEKKKQILFKKAESFGIDLDEFEMVLDAKVFEKQQQPQNTTVEKPTMSVQTENKESKLSSIQQLIKTLDEYESNRMREFRAEMEQIKNNQHKFSLKNLSSAAGEVAKELIPGAGLVSGVVGMFKDDDDELTPEEKIQHEIIEKKKDIISNFLISTDKGDILEFLRVAVPKVQNKINKESGLDKAWEEKCKEVVRNAKRIFANDSNMLSQIEPYDNELNPKGMFGFLKKAKNFIE